MTLLQIQLDDTFFEQIQKLAESRAIDVEQWAREAMQAQMPIRRRVPPPELKGSVTWTGDPTESLFNDEEWEAFHERTARQIAGEPEAFR